ncbi:unnamed protein product [Rotaria sp. Silwood1]|nr:unnamed protein product [Rotaria sp. Silwood1]CAF3654093.1 unnamed protein product [Rotaria sp. Silwood1]
MIYVIDPASIDENIDLIYEKDDIRLCTIQRAVPQQKLGFCVYYHRKEHFHYIEFYNNWELSLAYQAGIKNFDRIIELNGINIEKDTPYELRNRFNIDQNLPVHMLVCSPATYIHYKSTGKLLHSHLRTVHHLRPVYAISRSKFIPPQQLICDVFSNKFPSLRHVHLGRIDYATYHSWTTSPSLQFVSIFSCKSMSILAILTSCPNLHHLQVHIFPSDNHVFTSSTPLNHPLRRLIVWSNYTELYFNDIDRFLAYTPNVEYLYLQTVYRTPFIHLAEGLINRLHHLFRFDCYIREMLTRDSRIGNLASIHKMHSCFCGIQCKEENDKCRIFST